MYNMYIITTLSTMPSNVNENEKKIPVSQMKPKKGKKDGGLAEPKMLDMDGTRTSIYDLNITRHSPTRGMDNYDGGMRKPSQWCSTSEGWKLVDMEFEEIKLRRLGKNI